VPKIIFRSAKGCSRGGDSGMSIFSDRMNRRDRIKNEEKTKQPPLDICDNGDLCE
jgi:hypothetical protein